MATSVADATGVATAAPEAGWYHVAARNVNDVIVASFVTSLVGCSATVAILRACGLAIVPYTGVSAILRCDFPTIAML